MTSNNVGTIFTGKPLKDDYTYSKEESIAEEKSEPVKPIAYGTGITEEEIKKIISEFK